MHFVDRLCLAWYSENALAACMPAGMTHFTVFCFPQGIAAYCVAFVAQYWGAGRPEKIASMVWQGLYIGFISLPLIWLTGLAAPWFFNFLGHPAGVAANEAAYYQSLCVCGGACVMTAALIGFFSGRGKTWIVMAIDTFASILNIALDLLLIFGTAKWSWWFLPHIPEMGIVGAGLATSISVWVRTIIYFAVFWSKENRAVFHTWKNRYFEWAAMKRLFYFGAPNGLLFVIENVSFTSQLLMMGMIGAVEIAATNLAFNVNALAFVPMLGLGMGLTALVGQQQGRKRPNLSVRATRTTLTFALLYLGLFSSLYVLCPNWFLAAHEWGHVEGFSQTKSMAIYLLRFVALFMLFDGLNVIFSSVLRGAGDTAFILIVSAIIAPAPMLLDYIGIKYFNMGITYTWIVLTCTGIAAWICYYSRYRSGKWKSMQIIEPEVIIQKEDSVIGRCMRG